MQIASFKVAASDNDEFGLELERQSNGRTPQQAKELAIALPYHYEQDSTSLRLPRFVEIGQSQMFRGPLLTSKLYVPKGRVFKISNLPRSYSKTWSIQSSPFYSIRVKNKRWQQNSYYRMNEDGTVELLGTF